MIVLRDYCKITKLLNPVVGNFVAYKYVSSFKRRCSCFPDEPFFFPEVFCVGGKSLILRLLKTLWIRIININKNETSRSTSYLYYAVIAAQKYTCETFFDSFSHA